MAVSIKVIRDDFVQAKQNYEESNNIAAYTDFLTTYSDETLAKPFINSINEVLSNETKPKPPKVDVMSEILAEHDSKKPVEPKVEKNPTVKVAQPKRKDRVKPNTPGIYVSLPSKGRWYSGELEMSADGEIEVFPLRAKDELRLKSPDALFNGEALVSVLENIVPGIPNVIDMPVADQNVIMCGAYLATYGNDYTLSITCPKCSSIKEYGVDLDKMLTQSKDYENETLVNTTKYTIYLKPSNLKARNIIAMNQFESNIQQAQIDNQSDVDRIKALTEIFEKTIAQNFDLIVKMVDYIVDKDTGEKITDSDQIIDITDKLNKRAYDKLFESAAKMNEAGVDPTMNVSCVDCKHEFQSNVNLDPTSFFA
jgi:hypothetical protein